MTARRTRTRSRRLAAAGRQAAVGGLIVGLSAPLVAGSAGAAVGRSTLLSADKQSHVKIVIYSDDPLATAGAKAYRLATGNYPVTVVGGTASQLVARIEAQGNHPQWDVLWLRGDEAFPALDARGLLLRHWAPPVHYTSLAQQIIPKDRSYAPIALTMAGALVYNANTVPKPPTSWGALTSPEYRGAVGMTDPTGSSPSYPEVAGMAQELGGVAQGEAFYEKLKANGLHVYGSDAATLHALESGSIKFATIQSSAGTQASLETHGLKVAYLKPETVLPSVIAVAGGLPKKVLVYAKWISDLMYSQLGQYKLLTADPEGVSLFWPVLRNEKPQPALPPLSSVPAQVINASTWGPRQAA
ncbi:MAG: extracellular solute-binding protein, partial [Acidimicrobiaceae bacterium]|nr:extracellular solute-binding protein [Acidimicrobiaceae bacterium]